MQSTAVLIFANSSQEEKRYKPLQRGEVLFDSLTNTVIRKVKQSKLTYFHISEKHQKGTSFGERFSNAVQSVFDKGFDNVITVGNDTPHLQTAHITTAAKALADGKTVIGPSLDGGFYLMGIHKADFNRENFQNLPWQKFNLLKSLLDNLQENSFPIVQLPTFRDIDSIKDILSLVNHIRSISVSIQRLFALCLWTKQQFFLLEENLYTSILLQNPYNKGSPVLVHIQ
ncbi:DUF2064 domain-containing protein [Maribacter algicola]|uniref:DUF2064 domain-containing protein n=1 Tax=Maribacter algicola TaxID=2498892 RepID=A0A426RLX9_9FLAO|nr:DUF2064 domain-containing protein [Maribacter algicola]RRQ50005.1 DUF2064 domain-containing protein [Maribacter algicola]